MGNSVNSQRSYLSPTNRHAFLIISVLCEISGQLLNHIQFQCKQSTVELKSWWMEVEKITKAFLPGLFTYCEQPKLPRTNNAMEQYIKYLKSDFLRILGRKFIHRFFLRRAEFWAFSRELKTIPTEVILGRLKSTAGEIKFSIKERFEELSFHFRLERVIVVNLENQLEKLCEEWIMIN